MATLEKIRSKSVFLIVIIGVALLAFIVGDALTNSRNLFGDTTTVAKVDGEKIDYTEYQRKREELNQQLEDARKQNPQQYANFDTQILGQMAVEQLIGEKLLDRAVENSGIRTTGNQLRYYMLDNPVNPKLQTLMQQLAAANIQAQTPAQAYEIIFNPKRNGLTDAQVAPFQRYWIAMEEETKQLVARNTYQRLLVGTVKANDLDKRAIYKDYVEARSLNLAFKPYGQLDEKKYPVSDAEVASAYKKQQYRFKVAEPTKEVAFIAVNITPSAADINASKALAKKAVAAMRDTAGIGREMRREGVVVERRELRASDIRNTLIKNYVATAPADSVTLISETAQGFTAVKMLGKKAMSDSIQLNLVQVLGAKLPAKVLASLNAGTPVDSITKLFKADSVMVQKEQWIPLFTANGPTNAMNEAQLDSLTKAGGRFVELMSQPEGAVLAQVAKQNAPVEIYEYEEVNYDIKPSTKTINDERTKFEKFLAQNATTAKFKANAPKAGYSVQEFSLTQSSPAVPRFQGMNQFYPESRQVVRWVMIDGEDGEVSHVYESKDAQHPALYAVAVESSYEDYVPVTNAKVKEVLTSEIRGSKAGDAMMKQYQPKTGSMASVAQAMGVQPNNVPDFRFGRSMYVNDPAVVGKIAGSKPGKVVLVKGKDGIYAYQIIKATADSFPYDPANYDNQYLQMVNPDLNGMLRGKAKVTNNIYKFEAGD